jgi:hypothetical protein
VGWQRIFQSPQWALFLAMAKIWLAKTGAAAETVGIFAN